MKPLVTGTALRDATVRDYKRMAERAGLPVDMGALERLAVADCELGEAVEREERPRGFLKPDPAKEQEKRDELARQAAEQGASIIDSTQTVRRELAALHARPRPGSRWSYAMGRLRRILEGSNVPSRTPWENCEMPALAKKVRSLQAFIIFRGEPVVGDEPNPLFGLSDRDFQRKFRRLIEDICDESTGRMGPWWVPK